MWKHFSERIISAKIKLDIATGYPQKDASFLKIGFSLSR
jgi:hypothetical protein